MRGTTGAKVLMMLAVTSCGGAAEVTRTVQVPGRPAERPIEVSENEAAQIDGLLAQEPGVQDSADAHYRYWRELRARKVEGPEYGKTPAAVRQFIIEEKDQWYAKRAEGGPAPTTTVASARPAGSSSAPDAGAGDPLQDPAGLKQACEAGDASKCFNAGLAYANGHSVPVDLAVAADLYRRACDAGHSGACINLGYDFENGTGVAQSWDQALAMYNKGCSFTSHRMASRACNDAKRLGDRKAIADAEVKAGRCNPDRAARAQAGGLGLKRQFDAMSTGSDLFKTEDTRIIVATEAGTSVPVTPTLSGEYHLFVVGADPVRMTAQDGSGYDVQAHSDYEQIVKNSGPTDSRVLQASSGHNIPVKVFGHGCALLLVVRKL